MHHLATLLLLLCVTPAAADTPEDEVRTAIDQFFDGMRAGDSTAVRAAIHPQARLQTTMMRDGKPALQTGSVDAFVEAVGSPRDEVWDEKIWDVEVRVDGSLAQAWMQYAFFLGDSLSHCGVNAFQLFNEGAGWRIIQIADTRRRNDCKVP